jgi:hypothetical protein
VHVCFGNTNTISSRTSTVARLVRQFEIGLRFLFILVVQFSMFTPHPSRLWGPTQRVPEAVSPLVNEAGSPPSDVGESYSFDTVRLCLCHSLICVVHVISSADKYNF